MRKIETGGKAGYIGYEYQILTSVWIALDLMLVKHAASEVEIEPASDEDVGAKLIADPSSTVKVPLRATNLQVQIKHRSSQWLQRAFRDVLQGKEPAPPDEEFAKGAKNVRRTKAQKKRSPRPTAIATLAADPDTRYILITDAAVVPVLRPFEIGSLVELSGAATVPWTGGEPVSVDVAGRIAILPLKTREVLELAIDKILGELGSVPAQKKAECREALAQAVRLRLLNRLPSNWKVEELQTTIQKHGGYCDPGQTAVLPENFGAIESALDRFNAVLITGPAGTGKTVVARELVRRRRLGPDAADFIHNSEGLGAVRLAMEGEGKHVFFIEDPWGSYERDADAALWHKALPDLVARAQPRKQFIITTRTSVRHTVIGDKLPPELARIEHELRPDHYSPESKLQIFRQAFQGAKPWQKNWATRHLHEILDQLAAPLALYRCARRIWDATDEHSLSISTLIKQSKVEILADTFVQEIRGREDDSVGAVLALWAWQISERAVSEESVVVLRKTLAAGGLATVPDVRKLHRWLAASGWWERLPDGLVAHPTVLAGAEALARDEPEVAERIFGALLGGLVARGERGRALTLRQQVRKHVASVADEVEKAVANFAVESLLTTKESDWQRAFYQAQSLDLQGSPVGTLVNGLKTCSDGIFDRWTPPELTSQDIAAISHASEAREVARRWVLAVLPHAQSFEYGGEEVADFLRRFGFDFSNELFQSRRRS